MAEHRLQSTGSVVVAHEFSCCEARGIFGDQGLNPCLLPWQADSLPLSHQGGPSSSLLKKKKSDLFIFQMLALFHWAQVHEKCLSYLLIHYVIDLLCFSYIVCLFPPAHKLQEAGVSVLCPALSQMLRTGPGILHISFE